MSVPPQPGGKTWHAGQHDNGGQFCRHHAHAGSTGYGARQQRNIQQTQQAQTAAAKGASADSRACARASTHVRTLASAQQTATDNGSSKQNISSEARTARKRTAHSNITQQQTTSAANAKGQREGRVGKRRIEWKAKQMARGRRGIKRYSRMR